LNEPTVEGKIIPYNIIGFFRRLGSVLLLILVLIVFFFISLGSEIRSSKEILLNAKGLSFLNTKDFAILRILTEALTSLFQNVLFLFSELKHP